MKDCKISDLKYGSQCLFFSRHRQAGWPPDRYLLQDGREGEREKEANKLTLEGLTDMRRELRNSRELREWISFGDWGWEERERKERKTNAPILPTWLLQYLLVRQEMDLKKKTVYCHLKKATFIAMKFSLRLWMPKIVLLPWYLAFPGSKVNQVIELIEHAMISRIHARLGRLNSSNSAGNLL